ncbi:MAG: VWA domain-containing protein [Smithellaceae bacterium]|nr:VWA domain-containing protein [Smithellaceae bacterium]
MINLILKFASCCRAAGLRISPSEVLDCATQLALIDVLDEEQFRPLLRANFAKSRREQPKFDQLYDLFFHELRPEASISQLESLAGQIGDVQKMLKELAQQEPGYKTLVDFLNGDPMGFLKELEGLHTAEDSRRTVRFNLGPLGKRLEILMQINNTRNRILQFLDENNRRFDRETRGNLAAYFNEHLGSAYGMLMNEPRPDNASIKQVKSYEKRLKDLGEKPFSSLTQKELDELRDAIEQLVRKLKDIVSRRYARKNRGILDVKKTIRRAARYQSVPIEIHFRKRPPHKSKIVALCDVSSSVWAAARFMLSMVYSLHECFTRVNSFVFVSGIAEVTEIFDNNEVNLAIDKVLKEADIEYLTSTDYGETLRQFKENYMDCLNKKTTLIIIGDARTNYSNPEERILGEMREKCRRVIWLNPEPEQYWYSGDSEMSSYRPYCHELRPCRNLNQLTEFIEELVL